jgi:hypothetical protein
MAHIIADRIKETAIVIGTGTASLLGAVSGHKAFSSAMSIGDTCIYVIINSSGSQWETGIGTYSAANTITRTTVKSSTNNNNLVVFNGEVVNVFMGVTASAFPEYNPITKNINLNIDNLSDISIVSANSGDVLRFDGLTQDWINSPDVMAVNGDSWNTLLRRMNKLMESLTIVDSQQRQRVAVETMPTTTVAGTLTVQSSAGNFIGQNQAVGGAVTSAVSTYFVSEAPVDQRWRIIDDSHTCYAVSIRSKLTFS